MLLKRIYKYFSTLIEIVAGNKKSKTMYKRVLIHTLTEKDVSFSVIAVRCNSQESTGKRKMTKGQLYTFLDGYEIQESFVKKNISRIEQDRLYNDYYTENLKGKPHLQITAIVGQNGSGKSSIVEFMMRLINNFAAASLGEEERGPAAARLHFIDGVDGDLWYAQDNNIYHLTAKNAHVKLIQLKETDRDEMTITYRNRKKIFDNKKPDNLAEVKEALKGEQNETKLKDIYSHFFYTLVTNQSIYAYNTNDFEKECNDEQKERSILGPKVVDDKVKKYTVEERCWLHGIFHKNDGYQTPIVITPFREEGNIDINKENLLALERLVSLLVIQEDLRIINGHLKVKSLSYSFETETNFGYEAVKDFIGFEKLTETGYQQLRKGIVGEWGTILGEDLTKYADKRSYYWLAVDYLVYKTLKISKQYREHHDFFHNYRLMANKYDEQALKKLIVKESEDHSHITRKAMQALAYILFGIYDLEMKKDAKGNYLQSVKEVDFMEINKRWNEETEKWEDCIKHKSLWNHIRMCALTVPTFFRYQINVCDLENEEVDIDFKTLSSGEKQQAYSISSILYHLDNLNSAKKDTSNPNRIIYKHVNVVLEEIELYYHPELQQQFIKFFIDGLNQMTLENIKSINVMIVTHSPYVLSDIPRSNVLALKKDQAEPIRGLRTFGANIHDMLKDSFFLRSGSIGCFAQWEIGHLMACMEVYRWARTEKSDTVHLPSRFTENEEKDAYTFLSRYIYSENVDGRDEKRFSLEHFKKDFSQECLLRKIELFDEPVIKHILLEEFHHTFPENDRGYKAAKKRELERQLAEL